MRLTATLILALATSLLGSGAARALQPPPDLRQRVGFDQQLGVSVPGNLEFREASGTRIRFGDLLGKRPAILVLGYYTCPNLCDATFDGLTQAVQRTGLTPGKDMDVILVSIDPEETPAIATRKQAQLAHSFPRAGVEQWHFLTGPGAHSKALASAVGFRYFYDQRNQQYAHAAGLIVLTRAGKTTRYLFGVQFPPKTLRLSLVDASANRIGSPVDHLLLLCCGYNPTTGQYSLVISKVMRVAGVGFALLLALFVLVLHRRQRTRGAS